MNKEPVKGTCYKDKKPEGKEKGRGVNKNRNRLNALTGKILNEPGPSVSRNISFEIAPLGKVWAFCFRHHNALTTDCSTADAGMRGRVDIKWISHSSLLCRQSWGLCAGYLGNSLDVKLQKMCYQAAGDTIADFFFFFFAGIAWCQAIVLTPLNQFPHVQRGEIIHLISVGVPVSVCMCKAP